MKNKKRKQITLRCAKVFIFAVFLIGIGTYIAYSPDISVQTILDYTPENLISAAFILWLLYAVKSATIVFPIMILEIAGGHLFPKGIAFAVNLLGICICLTIPYWIGRFLGMETVEKLVDKYPKFAQLINKQQRNSFFVCFFLRIISCLPLDVVSMYLGATKTPFRKNLAGGLLGILPGMTLATLLGTSIQDIHSPVFWISAILKVAMSALSLPAYYLYRKYKT